MTGLLETVVDAGRYDVVFVESTEHAYSRIKRLAPQLIIVCLNIDEMDGFRVLSMLKLDNETRGIRLVTCTVDDSDDEASDEILEEPADVFSEPPALGMN
jgi:CheY-like chemotaxis protein